MALKDWKLRHKSKGLVTYTAPMGEVVIAKKFPDNKPIYWEVRKSYGFTLVKPEYEKFTKFSNALAHAKAFMRTH